MIILQQLINGHWVDQGTFITEELAWSSLNDVTDYRTTNKKGKVLTDYS